MWKLIMPGREWLYEGPKALHRAKFAAKLMLRRKEYTDYKAVFIVPYGGFEGETFVVSR
jgi:hypothetical protein